MRLKMWAGGRSHYDKELGISSKVNGKPLDSFKQWSEMIKYTIFNLLVLLSGEWIIGRQAWKKGDQRGGCYSSLREK